MEDNLYLKDIKVEIDGKETYLYTWDYVEIPDHDVRIYYKPSEDGFDFYAVERISYEVNEKTDKDPWHPYYCQVEYVVYGVSDFYGIRHLYFTSNNLGYTYCPNIGLITDTLTTLKKMEEFHVGFEYEWKRDGEGKTPWTKSIMRQDNGPIGDVDAQRVNDYRVKYLDKQDIEDLGWYYDISFDIYHISIDGESGWTLSCHKGNVITIRNTYECRFHGKVKNKSELKKLMSMLNIDE